ncbi:septin-2-like [Dicentrarchus labrax]|uniref:AIG1-type G domain-containing protein n=1 Tax=Dicentrarchus labrax TaxID=13489 RepID=A0A8P4G6E5_DICLA|nr:septin-2-like [Dicentrarchus labrax]XP_051253548.1 septin-2-like [Dicentrarchus labrax]
MANENTNTSSKYDDITSKSLIQSGSPTRYQLKLKDENIGNLKRMTLGEKNPKKTNKTILLVGETGAGKSTLINALVNYAMGVEWEDDVWFEIVKEEKKSQSKSQTSDVIVYQIFGFEDKTLPYSLTIIDTPGYGSTAGIEQDAIVSQRLFDLFRSVDGVHEMNAVGLVLRASENRLSDRLRYIFDSVASLFGKDMEMNIVALITHSDGVTPEDALQALEDAEIKCAKNEENEPLHFMFNNRQRKQKTKKNQVALKNAWDITMDQMRQFTDFLENASPQNLITTVEVLKSRIRLTAYIQNLQERIELIELKQKEIQQTKEGLKNHEQEMNSNKMFTVEVEEVYKDKEPINGGMWWLVFFKGAVCCKVCEENCHFPGCTVAWKPEYCEVMKDGRCTVCTGKCPVSDHVKENWKFVNKTKKVKKTKEDMKEKYEKCQTDCQEKTSLLENLQKKMEELQKEKDQLLEKSFKHVVKLDEIALNVNALSTYVHLDILIDKMKEKGDTDKVKKLMELKSRVDEGTTTGVRSMFSKLRAAGSAVTAYIK